MLTKIWRRGTSCQLHKEPSKKVCIKFSPLEWEIICLKRDKRRWEAADIDKNLKLSKVIFHWILIGNVGFQPLSLFSEYFKRYCILSYDLFFSPNSLASPTLRQERTWQTYSLMRQSRLKSRTVKIKRNSLKSAWWLKSAPKTISISRITT